MNRRNFLTISGLIGVAFPALFLTSASAKTRIKVYEYTFLKSLDPKPDNLIRFIVVNWFAMDKIAVKKGLMVEYSVFEAPDESDSWNVAVAVGYPTENGYQAITDEFEKIRQKHQKVLIDGKDLKELGKVVGSRKFYPRATSKT
jgi:hypothetical protein